MKFSLLILTHNRRDLLMQTIASIRSIRFPSDVEAELIVVANACTDDTVAATSEAIRDFPIRARVVVEDEPGLNVARNRGVREGSGDVLCFLDDDVLLDPGWLEGMHQTFRDHNPDIVGGRVELWWKDVDPPNWLCPPAIVLLSGNDRGTDIRPTFLEVIGANFAVRRDVFDRIGDFKKGFDRTPTSLMGGGETQLVLRAHDAGLKVLYSGVASLKHYVAPNRLKLDYLATLAFNQGVFDILTSRRTGAIARTRQLIGRSYLVVKLTFDLVLAKLRGNPVAEMTARLYRMRHIGALRQAMRLRSS